MIVMQGQGFLDISPSYPLNEVADDLVWIHLVDVQARATSFKRGASRGACTWPYFRSGSMRINVNSKSKKKTGKAGAKKRVSAGRKPVRKTKSKKATTDTSKRKKGKNSDTGARGASSLKSSGASRSAKSTSGVVDSVALSCFTGWFESACCV